MRDQGACGACWAFASTDCLATRIAIATSGRHKPLLSPAEMVFCNLGGETEYTMAMEQINQGLPYDFNMPSQRADERIREKEAVAALGCQGETLIGAWQYLYRFGAAVEECVPYKGGYANNTDLRTFGQGGPDVPACADIEGDEYDICPTTGKVMQVHRAAGYYYVPGAPNTKGTNVGMQDEAEEARVGENDVGPQSESGTEIDIRREIYHWGPVTSGFTVHQDFETWDGKGVYSHDGTSAESGGHAIIILGWGSENGVLYWVVRNSWGDAWGDGGYFKMKRGTNECGIEENVLVGFPNLYGYRLYIERPLLYREHDLALRSIWSVGTGGYKATVIERMLDGRLPPTSADIDAPQYNSAWWPNLSTFVAGLPNRTEYPLKRGPIRRFVLPRNEKERNQRVCFVMGAVLGIGVTSLIAYFYLTKISRTKRV